MSEGKILEKFEGKKIGKSCVIIPLAYKNDFFKLIEEHKVQAKAIEVFA